MTHDAINFSDMKNNLKHSVSVEQYLSGEMSPTEREMFEREVASNPSLAEELKLSRVIDSALKHDDILDLRKKLLSVYKENRKVQPEVPVVHLNFRKFWYAAASFILLAAIGSTLYFTIPGGKTNKSLFNQYYSSDNLVNITRASDANIVEAVIKFQEKDYTLAARLFRNLLELDNNNIAYWFYYGISSIETESYDQAIQAFNHIIADDQNLYVEHSKWYLGLTYLKNNQIDLAKRQFSVIANDPDNSHNKEAQKLLDKLQ
jgi:tetratricopeptide (TPR) repeat protein